ncbi:Phage repressor protein C, contains Cro/C1-type HTH and peptisase s24 domains [Paraburkholderia lycopersici]|uniref:Phage repressor protein C, contains Cro/C1-type HTH and peptisase s24 domains n=2 Tax=Paraburkholderia lycopersici TaxID=416944 RepID=A0A1G7CTI8_9BURK|nr:Phage repressor protein C, contains Cro/C1-type HTH and peptisase s24 domains [Paraburkholderia lycopersici]
MEEKKVLVQAIVDRMKEVVGVTKDVELAEAIGASRSQPAVWKIRERVPFAECVNLAEKFGVSLDWLVLGRGTPGIEEPELELHEGSLHVDGGDYVEFPAFDMRTFLEAETPSQAVRMPRTWLQREGIAIEETIAMRVAGNNQSPTVGDGDVVLVDRRPHDVDGMYLLRMGDGLRLRRVQRMHGGELHLRNDNPIYATDVIPADQVDSIEFIGYCYALFRHVR